MSRLEALKMLGAVGGAGAIGGTPQIWTPVTSIVPWDRGAKGSIAFGYHNDDVLLHIKYSEHLMKEVTAAFAIPRDLFSMAGGISQEQFRDMAMFAKSMPASREPIRLNRWPL